MYFAGWTYAYNYFDGFNLPLGLIEPSVNEIVTYGLLVLSASGWIAVGNVLSVLLLACCVFWYRRLPLRAELAMGIVTLLVCGWFYLAHISGEFAGRSSFDRQLAGDFPAYPRVAVGLAPGVDGDSTMSKTVADGCGRVVIARPDYFAFIRPHRQLLIPPQLVVIVPVSTIEWMQLSDVYESCD